ncbi:MAG: ABC transporter substrate-binding protein [Planctomycetota bacterium]
MNRPAFYTIRMKRFITLGLAIVGLFAISGCGAPADPASTIPSESVLIYASGADATTLDPADAEDGESVKVIVNVHDTLLTYADDSAELIPGLATKWTESPDRLEWTFELRENVKFHDGTPFDAEAVVFSLERLIDPNHPHRHDAKLPLGSDYQVIEKVEAKGTHVVILRLKHPSGVLLRNLAMFPSCIVSPTAVKESGEDYKIRPVGTGPFRFEEWVTNEKLVLRKNEAYWRGAPEVEHLIFKPIAEPASRLRQLATGEIDMADGLSIPVREEIRKNSKLRLATSPGMNFGYFAMNMDRPPFGDVRVRRAIAHAIDKKAILASAYDNAGQITSTPLPPTLWGADPEIRDYPFDPGRAKELLKKRVCPRQGQVRLLDVTE